MFYNRKWIFFVVLYAMCAVLYYFINQQIILTGFISGLLLGSVVLYALVLIVLSVVSLIFSLVSKYCYRICCGICKIKPQQMLATTCWMIFTILSYCAVFIIFLKMIEY
jgi:hypothetical protein